MVDDRHIPDRLQDLLNLRMDLLEWMDDAPVDRKSALVAQFRETLAEIHRLAPPEQKGDIVDEVKARRDARRSGSTSDKGRAAGTS